MIPALKQLQESAGTADTGHSSKDKAAPALTANFRVNHFFCVARDPNLCLQ